MRTLITSLSQVQYFNSNTQGENQIKSAFKPVNASKQYAIQVKAVTVLFFCFLNIIYTLLPAGVGGGSSACKANNLTLGSTITVASSNEISFTIKWDNSWYASTEPSNWDAVWLFVKYKDCATTNWLHAPLSTTLSDHSVTGGVLQVEMPAVNDGKGVFVRRSATGSGNIALSTVTLKLNGITTGSYNFQVFGIEMVKVLNEDFQIGDGTSTSTFNGTITTITGEGSLTAAQIGGGAVAIPAAYPKGWNAFYCMKYEITQQQYVDFLNTLTYDQQANRVPTSPNIMATNWAMGPNATTVGRSRNGIKVMTSGLASTTPAVYACDLSNNGTVAGANYNDASDGQNLPCNYLSWADLVAYLDWACLRPMTDLEFEKTCRGKAGRVGGEYVWGTISITQASSVSAYRQICEKYCSDNLTSRNTANEISIASGNGLSAYGIISICTGGSACNMSNMTCATGTDQAAGPIRVGFAATATTNRITSGASYYGAMDMGGNLMERIVALNTEGVTFTNTLGDGLLSASGNANTTTDDGGTWPSYSSALGSGSRGGDFSTAATYLRTSDRTLATTANTARVCSYGGRGVR